MKKNRKIAVLLCAASLMQMNAVPSFAKSDINLLHSNDFEDFSIGATPKTSWEMSVGSNVCKIDENSFLGSKGVYFRRLTDEDLYLQKSVITYPTDSKIGYSTDVMLEDTDTVTATLFRLRDENAVFVDLVTLSGGAIKFFDGREIGKYIENVPVQIDVLVDFKEKNADVFVNGKKKASGVSFANTGFKEPILFRMLAGGKTGENGVYMDNIYVYSADRVITDDDKASVGNATASDVLEKMHSSIALYDKRTNALAFGKKIANIAPPQVIDGAAYVPLRFVAEMYGATVTYNNDTKCADVRWKEKYASVGENTETKGNLINGTMYIDANEVSDLFDKKLLYDECGLIVITDKDELFNWNDDLNIMNRTIRSFIYDDYDALDILYKLKSCNPNSEHPRILARQDTFDTIRKKISEDEIYAMLWDECKINADLLLDYPLPQYSTDVQAQLNVARSVLQRMQTLGMAYQITGDTKYAQRIWRELETVCGYSTWLGQFLAVGEMSAAVAIGYDWAYDYLSEEQRNIVETALIEKAIKPAEVAFAGKEFWVSGAGVNNWSFVCWGGVCMAALAIMDRTESERCAETVSAALENIPDALSLYAPDGAWEEGTTYWNYATKYEAFLVSTLVSALGSDMGVFDVPGMRNTCETMLSLIGSAGYTFNFSDANVDSLNTAAFCFLADRLNRPEFAKRRATVRLRSREDRELDMIWLSRFDYNNEDIKMPLDIYSRGIETVTMRSSWEKSGMYIGMHTGDNAATHSHLDMGTFILDSQGERFFLDLGQDNYDLSAISKQLYRGKTEGHNCIFLNTGESFDQVTTAKCKIDRFESFDKGAYAISNLTAAYAFGADLYKRGIMLTDDRTAAIVQDEIELKKTSDLYWCSQTEADIELTNNNKNAILTLNGKKLLVKILSEGNAEFTVTDAIALNPENRNDKEFKNPGVHKLAIHYPEFLKGTISVGFVPVYKDDEDYDFGEVRPMEEWNIPAGNFEYATVEDIFIDGKLISDFNKNNYSYSYEIPVDSDKIPIITVTGNATVENAATQKGTAIIRASEPGKKDMVYTVSFNKREIPGVPEGFDKIEITDVKASAEPQLENIALNAIDGDISTRWSAENECNITFDLGEAAYFDAMCMAFMNGDKRTSHLVIETSTDGRHFTKLFEGDTSGTTAMPELYEFVRTKAQYIRLNLFGTSTGSWNSLSEATVLKKK